MSTRSGCRSCSLRSAIMPLRAVAATRNSPLPVTTSLISRRKNGLSSTMSTLGISEEADAMHHRGDLHPAVGYAETHRPAVVPADVLAHQREAHRAERLAGRYDV